MLCIIYKLFSLLKFIWYETINVFIARTSYGELREC